MKGSCVFHLPVRVVPDPEPEAVADVGESDAVPEGVPRRAHERETVDGLERRADGGAEGVAIPVPDFDGDAVALGGEGAHRTDRHYQEEGASREGVRVNDPDAKGPDAADDALNLQAAR
ncbi:hypothetical protein [Candidatus Palauibacter sp.]|uniref:hypothetical protein n=1 Tax=Candidatus Palauibacter sp. TaxID=3101350 RepID=UPI003B52FD1B